MGINYFCETWQGGKAWKTPGVTMARRLSGTLQCVFFFFYLSHIVLFRVFCRGNRRPGVTHSPNSDIRSSAFLSLSLSRLVSGHLRIFRRRLTRWNFRSYNRPLRRSGRRSRLISRAPFSRIGSRRTARLAWTNNIVCIIYSSPATGREWERERKRERELHGSSGLSGRCIRRYVRTAERRTYERVARNF